MTEIVVLDAGGVELGVATSKRSRWRMDDDGVLSNDETIYVTITARGKPECCELRGKRVTRSRGRISRPLPAVAPGDAVRFKPGSLCLDVHPKQYEEVG